MYVFAEQLIYMDFCLQDKFNDMNNIAFYFSLFYCNFIDSYTYGKRHPYRRVSFYPSILTYEHISLA